eukprot:s1778_g9.t1
MAFDERVEFDAAKVTSSWPCDPLALPSPSRPAMLTPDRRLTDCNMFLGFPEECVVGKTCESYGAASAYPANGRDGVGYEGSMFQDSLQPEGGRCSWFGTEGFGQGSGLPGLGLGFGTLGATPWESNREETGRPGPSSGTPAISTEAQWEAELRRRQQQLEMREAELQAESANTERQRNSLRYNAENMKSFADRIRTAMQNNDEQEMKIKRKQVGLFHQEREIKEFEEKVKARDRDFQSRACVKQDEHQEIQRQLNDLHQKDKDCEAKVNATKAAMDRLRIAEQEVEHRSKTFEEEKRNLENKNAIYKTEIRRLNHKLEQAQQKPEIIPVGHDGAGNFKPSQPPDRPPNIANLPKQNLPPVPFLPPPATPSMGHRPTPPPPAGRGQILDATWGAPQQRPATPAPL